MNHYALINPRRDHDGGNADTKSIECKEVRRGTVDPIWVGDPSNRSGHMIIEPTMLVVGNDPHHFIPLRTRTQRLVDLLEQLLSVGDVVRRVIIVGGQQRRQIEIPLLDYGVIRERAASSMLLEEQIIVHEVVNVLEMAEPGEKERGRNILVVYPERQPCILDGLEDCLLRITFEELSCHIADHPV